MRRIGIGVPVRIKGYGDLNKSFRSRDSVKFYHHLKHVVEMFQNIIGVHRVKTAVGKRIGIMIQVMQNVSIRTGIDIDPRGIASFSFSTADIKNVVQFVIQCAAFY